jgi:hypothetical protein
LDRTFNVSHNEWDHLVKPIKRVGNLQSLNFGFRHGIEPPQQSAAKALRSV